MQIFYKRKTDFLFVSLSYNKESFDEDQKEVLKFLKLRMIIKSFSTQSYRTIKYEKLNHI